MLSTNIFIAIILSPLIASFVVGFFGNRLGVFASHSITIFGVLISALLSLFVLYVVITTNYHYNGNLYNWLSVGDKVYAVGILIDRLTAMMLVVVTFVSLMVHIYTIGYMKGEDGYSRFFSYISLFTFMMLMLVTSNNFIQLFFGWEGVGLVSYLLIGFYYTRESAIFANMKAFLINRIGDFGFLLGIGLVLAHFGTLDYAEVFARLSTVEGQTFLSTNWHIITVICIALFVGAMGKSAQFPLHVWLPDSMEGPTPISALIHAATMVTAGIFMVARLSPMYNLSEAALSFIAVIGGINALFLGLLGLIQNDIKRVVAYSTLSQLGYMVVALGCGAYDIGVFHLMTHAFFKALLFLAAGSVIMGMHHEQDMRKMGGLYKYMPITYVVTIIGNLALAGIPPFAGFFSKDMILDSAMNSYHHGIAGSAFVVFAVYASVFVTALYSFRLLFMTFHGKENFRNHNGHSNGDHVHVPHESPLSVTLPLILLAIPSVFIGLIAFNSFVDGSFFGTSVINGELFKSFIEEEHLSAIRLMLDSFSHLPVYLAMLGILMAYILHISPKLVAKIKIIFRPIIILMENKYFMDDLYLKIFAPFARFLGKIFWQVGDLLLIDGLLVNGSAKVVMVLSKIFRKTQTGYVNSYATFMVLGLILLLTLFTQLALA